MNDREGGYYETYLEGVKDLAGMGMQERRLQQALEQRNAVLALQAATLQNRVDNSRRLSEQGDIRNVLMALRLKQQEGRGNYDLVTDPNNPEQQVAYDKNNNRILPVGGAASAPGAPPGSGGPGPLFKSKPLSDKELGGFKESSDEIQQAADVLRLLQGQVVGGVKGDPTATGWEGYIPGGLQTLLTPTRGGTVDKISRMLPVVGGGLQGMMGGEGGIRTRAAIAGLSTMKGKERSGATITPQEWQRLEPYLPTEKDNADEARDKTKNFLREYSNLLENKLMSVTRGGRPIPKALGEYVRRTIAGARALGAGKPGLSPEDINRLDAIYGR